MKSTCGERSCHALGSATAACEGACASPLALGVRLGLGLGLAGLCADTAASPGFAPCEFAVLREEEV